MKEVKMKVANERNKEEIDKLIYKDRHRSELVEVDLDSLKEKTKNELLKEENDAGYIIITAFKDDYTLEQNYKRNEQLRKDIKYFLYAYVPVWGEYKNPETGEVSTKQAYIVFNSRAAQFLVYDNTEELKKLGVNWAKEENCDQKIFIYKPSRKEDGENTYNLTPEGKVNLSFTSANFIDTLDKYFTNGVSHKQPDTFERKIYFLPPPKDNVKEAWSRWGEIFNNRNFYNLIGFIR
ncbi:MAG: hypothetical protein K9I74_00470 [Bacteroidales bacterium]|nr:hypothetical protein [Bacteroidales bacterium]